MMRSLFAGVSGLRNHQVRMDVIGNNISNVNTIGFKSSRVTFKESFAQLMQGASRPPGDQGGTNPMQVGLGSSIGSIDQLFTQGSLETTGMQTDLAVQGSAFFVLGKGAQRYYTRAGNFQLDADGRLVSPLNGFIVQGRIAVDGLLQEGINDIILPTGQKTAARVTEFMKVTGNLDAAAANFTGDIDDSLDRISDANRRSYVLSSIGAYDSLGNRNEIEVLIWKTDTNTWDWKVKTPSTAVLEDGGAPVASGQIVFNSDGTLDEASSTMPEIVYTPEGAEEMRINLDLGQGNSGLTQFGGLQTAALRQQDGYGMGQLQEFSIDQRGVITGLFTNGVTITLGQIALAEFNNPSGLFKAGDNTFQPSGNSGEPLLGFAREGTQSVIAAGTLELSNVDLSAEFTNMIVTQRGFQANSRVISNSDEMLQELVNLKR